jgi:hypothetical protein
MRSLLPDLLTAAWIESNLQRATARSLKLKSFLASVLENFRDSVGRTSYSPLARAFAIERLSKRIDALRPAALR